MKNILIATDYSTNAITALKYASTLSKKLNATLVVTHVFDYPTVLGDIVDEPFPQLEIDAFKTHYSKLKDFCKQNLEGNLQEMNISFEVVENKSVVKGIISKAKEIDAFIIVVGMKGTSLLKEIIMGNTTRKLIDKAPCFVLAIPENTSYKEIKTIVYATDFEVNPDIEVLQNVSILAKAFKAKIQVVHIVTKKEYAGDSQMEWFKEMLEKKIEYKNIAFEVLFSDTIFETLKVYLGDVNADMVVMLERDEFGFFNKIFHKDLVKKMEVYGQIPLMSFNENNFELLHFLEL
ncbi:universal stress protein [Olleya sp. HaHaR_3_96]|uniref:universal stress protein n=1 Tax=Olleya sp. HaHaR_3_96 TaxID=2745560 RepID=UPI001C4F72EA|nr:universal stress protein [Olleya sp. HaHaR_3_96]QXP58307.1 universal stress protein [Olleya sp. HaHaR_3_96]